MKIILAIITLLSNEKLWELVERLYKLLQKRGEINREYTEITAEYLKQKQKKDINEIEVNE